MSGDRRVDHDSQVDGKQVVMSMKQPHWPAVVGVSAVAVAVAVHQGRVRVLLTLFMRQQRDLGELHGTRERAACWFFARA